MNLSRGSLSLVCLSILFLAMMRPVWGAEPIHLSEATVSVIDGDTFQVDDTVIQLAGIDAPELGQVCENDGDLWPCGMIVAYELRKILSFEKRVIVCHPRGETDGAIIASCNYGDNDISRTLLLDGNAMALAKASQPYKNAQHMARNASLGIWRGGFIPPREWRGGKRLQNEPDYESSHEMRSDSPWRWHGSPLLPAHVPLHSACLIKGTRAGGAKVYLSPLDRAYPDTVLDITKGDQFFCSDDAARAAGWRRPGETASVN